MDSSGVHADSVYPLDVLLGLNPANGQARLTSGRRSAAETPITCTRWCDTVIMKRSIVHVHMRNYVISDGQ